MKRRALVTGVTGQDGSYLAELLISKGYRVFGLIRRSSEPNLGRIRHILGEMTLIPGDLSDGVSLNNAVRGSEPDEVYNLAGMSYVGMSYQMPEYTMETVFNGAVRLYEAVRRYKPGARVYQASSSEMFGDCGVKVQNEGTVMRPVSPYGVAKVGSHFAAGYYRRVYGMRISCGILFNHESPRRGSEFVTKKICDGLKAVKRGEQREVVLGTLDAKRDWGHAGDYVEAMYRMMKVEPGDFVIGTGETRTVKDFAVAACKHLGLRFKDVIRYDPSLKRDGEVPVLCADASKARRVLGWEAKRGMNDLVVEMLS